MIGSHMTTHRVVNTASRINEQSTCTPVTHETTEETLSTRAACCLHKLSCYHGAQSMITQASIHIQTSRRGSGSKLQYSDVEFFRNDAVG